MIYRETIAGHVYVNRIHFIVNCPTCREQMKAIEVKESDDEDLLYPQVAQSDY